MTKKTKLKDGPTVICRPRGRPAGRVQDVPMQMRVSQDFIKEVDDWRNKQPDRPSRAKAIRMLVGAGIEAEMEKAAPAAKPSRRGR
jgi:hypothetical protein